MKRFVVIVRSNVCPMVTAMVLTLSGCAMLGETSQSCKVYDPDLEQGVYSGGCKNGLAEGYGEVSGVSTYRGEFRKGKKDGKGIKVMPNGDRYEGEFRKGYRDGKGVYTWGNKGPWAGDRYVGGYKHDMREGWGVYLWHSGDRYEGLWHDNVRLNWSVMEIRRALTAKAVARSEKTGELVCAEARLGSVNHQLINGRIEHVNGEMVQVRIVAIEGGVASFQGKEIRVGDELLDKAVNWHICGHN